MRQKSPFSLYKRPIGNRIVWYYSVYDEYGKRLKYSTGCMSKTSATKYCMELYKEGKLIPRTSTRKPFPSAPMQRIGGWGKCPYLTSKIDNGYQIGKTYADTNRTILTKRIMPCFADTHMHKITVEMVESWMHSLGKEQKVGGKTLKALSRSQSVIMSVFYRSCSTKRRGWKSSRATHARKLDWLPSARAHGESSPIAEAKQIFSDPKKWFNHHAYVASLLASVTGARLSEIRALQCSDVFPDHVHIEHPSLGGEHQIKPQRPATCAISGSLYPGPSWKNRSVDAPEGFLLIPTESLMVGTSFWIT